MLQDNCDSSSLFFPPFVSFNLTSFWDVCAGAHVYGSGDLEVDMASSSEGQSTDAEDSDVTPLSPRSSQAESSKSDDEDQEDFQASGSGKSDDVIERLTGALDSFSETNRDAFEDIMREGGAIEVRACAPSPMNGRLCWI